MLTHDAILSGLVRGRSLADIGQDAGITRQAVHNRLPRLAAEYGMTREQLWEHVESVLATERRDRAERMTPDAETMRAGRGTGYYSASPSDWAASNAESGLDALADTLLAGRRWTPAKQKQAERCERVLVSYSFTR